MEQAREILIRYAQADFSKRINLYLQFPGLRDAFQELERTILSCSTGFLICECKAEQRRIFCSTIVPEADQRDIEIEKKGMAC
jgi:hypothetical protein